MTNTGQNPANLSHDILTLTSDNQKVKNLSPKEMALPEIQRLNLEKKEDLQQNIHSSSGNKDSTQEQINQNRQNERINYENGAQSEGKYRFSKKQNKKQVGFNSTITKSCLSFPQQDQILQNQGEYEMLPRLDRSTIIQLNFSLQPLKRQPSKKQIKQIVEKMKVEKLEKSKSQKRLLDQKILQYEKFINQIIEENERIKEENKDNREDILQLQQQLDQVKKILADQVQAKSTMAQERDSLLGELKEILEAYHHEEIALKNTIFAQSNKIQQLNQIVQSLKNERRTFEEKMQMLEGQFKVFGQLEREKNIEIQKMRNFINTSETQIEILAERLSQKQNQLDIHISLKQQSSCLLKDREEQIASLNNQIQSQKQQFEQFRSLYYKSKQVFERNNNQYKQRMVNLEKENDSYRQIIVSLNSTNQGLLKRLQQIDNSWIQDREKVLSQLQIKSSYSQNYLQILSMFDIRPGKLCQQKLLSQICQLRNSIIDLLKKVGELEMKVQHAKNQNSRLALVIEEQEQNRYIPQLENILIQQNEEILKQKFRIYNLFIQQKY